MVAQYSIHFRFKWRLKFVDICNMVASLTVSPAMIECAHSVLFHSSVYKLSFRCCSFLFLRAKMTRVQLTPRPASFFFFTQSCPCSSSHRGSPVLLVSNLVRICVPIAFQRWILNGGSTSYLNTLS